MNHTDELYDLLGKQRIAQDSDEMAELQEHRQTIEKIVTAAFPSVAKTIRYGGSKAKGTMIRESYDLDIIIYVNNGENGMGNTLKEIYDNLAAILAKNYDVELKNSALRLSARTSDTECDYLHIDIVPGRFVDDTKSDVYLHQNEANKERLKTNLETHINHIKNSGVTDALMLLKLMRVRHDIDVKQFALDLLSVDLLNGKSNLSLDDQVKHVLVTIRDTDTPITIEDPANPNGNDLTEMLQGYKWKDLQQTATTMLEQVNNKGWAAAYGEAGEFNGQRAAIITQAAESIDEPTKPWAF